MENRSDKYFGLIVDADSSVTYLHGYEVTMDGNVIVPELRQNQPAAPLKRINAVGELFIISLERDCRAQPQ